MALPVAELNDILATVPINGDYNLQAPGCMCYTGGCVRCQMMWPSGILMDFRVPSR